MVVLFFETSIVMFHDVSKKKRVFHAGPCSSMTCSIAGALSREIFWVMGCNGTSSRAAVLLARNSKSSIVEAPGKKNDDRKRSVRKFVMDDGPCDWGCNRHNRHKTGGRLVEQMIFMLSS